MASTNQSESVAATASPAPAGNDGITIESVNRISKIPVVESTIQTATTIYEKIKDYNTVTHWTLSTAENTVHKAIEVSKPITSPVVHTLEGPIKKVDEILCSGLDYVESKVPAIKLPPGEIYNNTKEYIDHNVTPKVQNVYSTVEPTIQTAKHMVEPAIQSAKNIVDPAVQSAKNVVEPAVQTAYHLVEPIVQPAVDKVNQILHPHPEHNANNTETPEQSTECPECPLNSNSNSKKNEHQQ
ncbi:perilipin-1 isoform X2 [Agrilus planipennis]|uniref:Perilipin-1 isoform X2 n=1 Tax=Agrilus planipennis TaxID=224129 RepID=A0A7F5QX75_AGRPL|nr:perilipin-1 isoform X2 [Agrilus planipennis]